MEIFSNSLLFLLGLFILILASDWLIQSSVKLANILRLTPLFVGLILIAFGTSAPEAGVGIMAAIRNQKGIALGNIIGSNIANIGLIVGLCAMVRPLKVDKSIFKREAPIMILATVLFFFSCQDLLISRGEGIIFIAAFITFCIVSYLGSRSNFDSKEIEDFKTNKILDKLKSKGAISLIIIATLVGIVLGADLMVRGGSGLAVIFGVSPWIIGITVFAIGTSLPELVTSLTASLKKISSISIGNIVGSNIFNLLLVLGIVAIIRPIRVDPLILSYELPAVVIFSLFLYLIMKTGLKVSRLEGVVLFIGYIVFLFFLFCR